MTFQPQQPNRAFTAERAVIGSILVDESVLAIAKEILEADDFFCELHQTIFKAMCNLNENSNAINLASVMVAIGNNQAFENAGGIAYLTECQHMCVVSMIEQDAKLVRDDSVRRKLLSFSETIKSITQQNIQDIDNLISSLSNELMSLSETTVVTPWVRFDKAMEKSCEQLINEDFADSIPSGFIDLDAKTTGFRPGTLTIIAARPAMGKTAFGLNIAANVAFDKGLPVAFFSLEMTGTELTNRIISARAKVNGNAIKKRNFTEQEWERILDVTARYRSAQIYIDDTAGLDINVLRDRAKRMHVQYGIKMLIVDYLQLMTCNSKRVQNREQEIATISRNLKGIAKDLKIPVIALAQLNRSVDSRAEKRPILSDLRESGSMEQDADNVMFIHRDDYYQPNSEPTNEAEVIIAKQRSGPTGIIKLHWNGEFTLFSNLEQSGYFD